MPNKNRMLAHGFPSSFFHYELAMGQLIADATLSTLSALTVLLSICSDSMTMAEI